MRLSVQQWIDRGDRFVLTCGLACESGLSGKAATHPRWLRPTAAACVSANQITAIAVVVI